MQSVADSITESFQSTFSVRRATGFVGFRNPVQRISIHVLREESDSTPMICGWLTCRFQSTFSVRRATDVAYIQIMLMIFQSTFSVRRATFADEVGEDGGHISIHVLREESDRIRRIHDPHRQNFNPRSP